MLNNTLSNTYFRRHFIKVDQGTIIDTFCYKIDEETPPLDIYRTVVFINILLLTVLSGGSVIKKRNKNNVYTVLTLCFVNKH